MTELRNCPFCGSAVQFSHDLWGEPDGIWCGHCHMMVRFSRIKTEKGETFGDTMKRMAKVWNRRDDDADAPD